MLNRTKLTNLARRLWRDESGGEALEYALIGGIVVVAALAVIGTIGAKLVARWTSLSSSS